MKKLLSIIFLLLISLSLVGLASASHYTVSVGSKTSNPNTAVTFTATVKSASATPVGDDIVLTSTNLVKGTDVITVPSTIATITEIFDSTTGVSKDFTINVGNVPAGVYTATLKAELAQDSTHFVEKTYTLTVNPVYSLEIIGDSVLDNTLIIATPKDYDDDMEIKLKNTGNAALTFPNQELSEITLEDSNGDKVKISFTNLPSALAPEQTHPITVSFDVDRKVDVDSYEGKITITAQELTKEFNLRVDVSPEDVCQDGRRGDGRYITSNSVGTLRITDFDVDPDDEFGPGEIIEIRNVEVENEWDDDINDVIVEAILYNVDQDEIIARAESDPEDVDEGDRVDFNDFELEVSSNDKDLDESDTYIIYLQAFEDGNEDEHCNYEFIDNIDFKREADDVDVISATATPSTVMCNANVNFVVTVQNVGDRDQDFVSVKLLDNSLDLDFESDPFSLDQFDDKDDTAVVTYTHKMPASTDSGSYNIEAIVVFNRGRETDSQFVPLKVECGDGSGTLSGSVSISLVQDSITVLQGKLFGLPFKLMNNADEVQTYVIDVSPSGNWADKPQPQTVTLQPGQETTLYTYLTPKADISSGSYNVEITAKQDNVVLATKTITVQVGQGTSGTPTGSTTYQPSVTASSVWRNLSGSVAFWIIAIIIVFTLIIYILTILLRPR